MSNDGVLVSYKLVDAVSMGASITSNAINIEHLDDIAFEANLTGAGTANGTFSVEVSISHAQDANGNVTTAGTWNALSLSPTPSVASGSPASYYIQVQQCEAPWIRLKYTRSSGTGTLDAFICGKKI